LGSVTANTANDLELLESWRAGDTGAGEALFERHFDAVVRFFRNKTEEGAEDLVQKTFLGCVEGRDRFRGDASFRTFLFAVAHNVLKNHFRSKRRLGGEIDFTLRSVHDLAPSPSTVVAEHRTAQLLLEALRRIPVEYQVALELHYWEDLTALEIAHVLDMPVGTSKTRLRRARQLLVEQMEQLADDGADLRGVLSDLETWARSLRDTVLRQ
jgi:RNA polymerase sigma-70 factor (ECF subfamily)